MRKSIPPLLIIFLCLVWEGHRIYQASSTWVSYPMNSVDLAMEIPISYESAEKCIEQFGRSTNVPFDRLCGRGCFRKSGKHPNQYECLEQSLNGAPVTAGEAGYLDLIVHSAFPFFFSK